MVTVYYRYIRRLKVTKSSDPKHERGEARRVGYNTPIDKTPNTTGPPQEESGMTSSESRAQTTSQPDEQNAGHESRYVNVERAVPMNEYEKLDSPNASSQNVYEQITST